MCYVSHANLLTDRCKCDSNSICVFSGLGVKSSVLSHAMYVFILISNLQLAELESWAPGGIFARERVQTWDQHFSVRSG